MKLIHWWNTFEICPRRYSNSGGSDMRSNALPVRPRSREKSSLAKWRHLVSGRRATFSVILTRSVCYICVLTLPRKIPFNIWLNLTFKRGCLCGLTSCAVGHISIAPGFKPRPGYVRRVFHLSFRFITFEGPSPHLAHLVHKSGP